MGSISKKLYDSQVEAAFNEFLRDLGEAIAYLAHENARNSVESVDLESSLRDAIYELDTAPDVVDPDAGFLAVAEAGAGITSGILPTPTKLGKLQNIRILKMRLFGGQYTDSDGTVHTQLGAFDALSALPDTE